MENYYGKNTSFLAKIVATVIIIASFIGALSFVPNDSNYHSVNNVNKGWIMSFTILFSGLFSASILLLLEAILVNTKK